MSVRRSEGLPPVALHVSPVDGRETEYCAWPVAALVVVVDPRSETGIDPCDVAARLGLTPTEGQVAALLAEGKTVREIASERGCKVTTIRTHVQRMFTKLGIKRQVDLVRLVLSAATLRSP